MNTEVPYLPNELELLIDNLPGGYRETAIWLVEHYESGAVVTTALLRWMASFVKKARGEPVEAPQ